MFEPNKENVPAGMFDGATKITGKIEFTQTSCNDGIEITGHLTGFSEGVHGWHIHTLGNAQAGCGSDYTGGHFNIFGAPLGAEDNNRYGTKP
jgi:Cu-Zn family superoxide dismutase